MNKPLKVRVTILTPVHIGCDDVYEPTNFRIENNKLIHFDTFNFISSLNDEERKKFIEICSKGTISSLLEVYKFVKNKRISGREIDIANGLIDHYEQVLNLSIRDESKISRELNNFAIARTAYIPNDNLPYIPGSSLKGSIRTAYLNKLAREKNIINYPGKSKDLEAELLQGTFSNDPFRFVKISDLMPVNKVNTKIYYAVNRKKDREMARGLSTLLESIEKGSVFEGIMNIETQTQSNNSINKNKLIEGIKNFYKSILEQELSVYNKLIINSQVINSLKALQENSILIKIGRHSGAEAVTIEGNRKIIIRGPHGRNTIGSSPTTVWLASEHKNPNDNSGLLPFGWAKIEFLDFDINNIFFEKIYYTEDLKIEKKEENQVREVNLKENKKTEIKEKEEIIIDYIKFDPGRKEIILEEHGKKIATKKLTDKSFVPESLRKKLFDKKEKVKAKVTVKRTGNLLEIVKIDVP